MDLGDFNPGATGGMSIAYSACDGPVSTISYCYHILLHDITTLMGGSPLVSERSLHSSLRLTEQFKRRYSLIA